MAASKVTETEGLHHGASDGDVIMAGTISLCWSDHDGSSISGYRNRGLHCGAELVRS